ncbi:MAG: hypothetical protein K2I16_10915 [Muribaculaceae bacterium]|nr:hypothetical protein [Muribaculaceae bacterium]
MKHNIFSLSAACLIAGVVASSCSKESLASPDPLLPAEGVPTLGISLGVEGATRATNPGEFEPGSGYENYLDITGNDYRIYFFDAEKNNYLATFDPYLKPSINPEPEEGTYYYTFMGQVPSNVGTKFKLVVAANWGTYPEEKEEADAAEGSFSLVKGVTTIKDLTTHAGSQFEALATPAEGEDWLGPKRLIPFYGVRRYDLGEDKYGVNQYIDSEGNLKKDVYVDLTKYALPLLRAMARVEVVLDNAYASFSSVKMTRYNSKGYCAPYSDAGGWQFDYKDYYQGYDYDWDTDFARVPHLVGGKNDANAVELEFKKVSSRKENDDKTVTPEKWVAYVPEYINVGTDDYTVITVTLANPDGETVPGTGDGDTEGTKKPPTNTIYFATNGTKESNDIPTAATRSEAGRYNIERNNIYRFTITGMTTTLTCQVDIQPFAEQILNMEFGLMYDERGDLMVLPDENGTLPDYFIKYMEGRDWPTVENSNVPLKPEKGDYYAIVLGEDGQIGSSQTEIWLKDSEGCRILSNFIEKTDDSQECSTRKVIHFFGLNESVYYKDIQGERRLHHYPNHWTIVLDNEGAMIFKDPDNKTRYRVESWDESDGCWIISKEVISTDKKTITTTLTLIDDVGNISNTIKEITEDYLDFKSKDDSSQ